jgi:ABC-2 type transport system ATP-binding protein
MIPALRIRQLRKVYDNGFEALKGIDLDVEPGEFFALLGPNGAGKSTTIGVISSLVRKSSGSVEVFGIDIDKDFSAAKRCIGIVPQEFNFHQFETISDILLNQAGYYGLPRALAKERADKYLNLLGLWDKRDQQGRMLSGGMKRRLMIARALVHEPKLLILDEPTAGVDIELRRSMWDFLRKINQEGITIILTTHYLEEAESLCRRIGIIDHGQLIENTSMKDLLKQLNRETFVFDTRNPLPVNFQISGFDLQQTDVNTLEIGLEKSQNLNEVFAALSAAQIDVVSMRNKANRLEELFVGIISNNTDTRAA